MISVMIVDLPTDPRQAGQTRIWISNPPLKTHLKWQMLN